MTEREPVLSRGLQRINLKNEIYMLVLIFNYTFYDLPKIFSLINFNGFTWPHPDFHFFYFNAACFLFWDKPSTQLARCTRLIIHYLLILRKELGKLYSVFLRPFSNWIHHNLITNYWSTFPVSGSDFVWQNRKGS